MIALFPGKFQPPHLGHVMTILDLVDQYDRVIVAITADGPVVMSQDERKAIFQRALRHLGDRVEVVTVAGVLTEYTSLDPLPPFDVCVSGNELVIDKIKALGKQAVFAPRSEGPAFSGTELRASLASKG